jgi:hypothetical protein
MASRTDWAEGMDIKILSDDSNVDVLFWVGCTAALEERNMKVAKAVAKVLQAAGVNFGILGTEETCCGEPARSRISLLSPGAWTRKLPIMIPATSAGTTTYMRHRGKSSSA